MNLRFGTRAISATALVLGLAVAGQLGARAEAAPPAFHDGDGLSVVSATQTDVRTWHLVVTTAAVAAPLRVDILLPEGYDSSTVNYPVLYLFHGTSGGADDWINAGNAAAATDPYPMIVVMPDAGINGNGGSWFTNWIDQSTSLHAANWETFHVDQLVPWIDANLRTVATRDGRAIAGLSQGGFGAFAYAARHPDLFAAAGSFSGAPDIASNPVVQAGAASIIDATAVGLDKVEPDAMFGDPVLDNINWQGHNPATLVSNLADTALALWSGNGIPGALDTPTPQIVPDALIEAAAHTSTVSFAQAARTAHVAYTLDDYGNGTHSWPYWTRDLTQFLPPLMAHFANPAPAPSAISYESIDKTWTQWGWTLSNTRLLPQAFSGLVNASANGFTVAAPNCTTITTPPDYVPGAQYHVTATGGSVPYIVAASPSGQLTIPVTPALLHASVTVTITQA